MTTGGRGERPQKPRWEERVVQEGRDGEYTEIYEILYQDGQRTARQLIDVIDDEPVPTIIEKVTCLYHSSVHHHITFSEYIGNVFI